MFDSPAGHRDTRELIAFRVGMLECCINIMTVREIRGWTQTTALPKSPPFVRGVINLRGSVLPVVDFAVRLGLPETELTERVVIIVVQSGAQQIGLLVDAVSDILTMTEAKIHPTPDVSSPMLKLFVRGLLSVDNRMISLITLENVLPALEPETV
ncbi:MAG TPA: chemotaxis protein CheW [Acidocella sp.]|jgi:purine-binding chemotaxis protein CheW|nr:MAG: chemotaxis protein CheW [Rhodospirillales bacterium 20-64-7]HQT46776.1 chemotaxis protein CheW [Acidocella sp.]